MASRLQSRRLVGRVAELGSLGHYAHAMIASDAQKQFARGLVGSWSSYLGGGNDMLIGMRLFFRDDGSGMMEEWGFDHHHLDPEYVSVPDFQWRAIADQTIDITHRGETRTVRYDFRTRKNEYDIAELRVFETGLSPDEHGEIGFWISPFSLVYQEPEKPARGVLTRLWKKLTR